MNNLTVGKKSVIVTFKITDELKRMIETICYRERITQTALVERLITEYHHHITKDNSSV